VTIAVDTNVLVRILIDDDEQPSQVQAARQIAEKHARLFIPATVQIELIWVLDFAYKLNKTQIITILEHLDENDAFILQHEEQFIEALTLFENSTASFADCIIYLQAKQAKHGLITFDKKFAKLPGVKLLPM